MNIKKKTNLTLDVVKFLYDSILWLKEKNPSKGSALWECRMEFSLHKIQKTEQQMSLADPLQAACYYELL